MVHKSNESYRRHLKNQTTEEAKQQLQTIVQYHITIKHNFCSGNCQ